MPRARARTHSPARDGHMPFSDRNHIGNGHGYGHGNGSCEDPFRKGKKPPERPLHLCPSYVTVPFPLREVEVRSFKA